MLRGALHVHSTWSDGEFSLAELREVLLVAGCRFAFVTDHADALDADRLEAYRGECCARSDRRFRFIAGLEFGCFHGMHVLGYGVSAPIASADPERVIAHIRAAGGVAVVAHPRTEAFPAIEAFAELPNGIEVWNSKYDGQYAPRPETFALLARLRQRRPAMTAFFGLDLHWRHQFRGLLTEVASEALDADALLAALRRGEYVGVKGSLRLSSSGAVAPSLLERFEREQARSQRLRRYARALKGWADRSGFRVPALVKARLRRMF